MTLREAFQEVSAPPVKPQTPTDLEALALLLEMREYLSDREHWTKRTEMERRMKYWPVPKVVTSYCLLGAAGDIGSHYDMARQRALGMIEEAICLYKHSTGWDIDIFNDCHSHLDVMNVLDLAIKGGK